MRPEGTRVWRKSRRTAVKGEKRGRRTTHIAQTTPPGRRSTWLRRHPTDEDFLHWLENAR